MRHRLLKERVLAEIDSQADRLIAIGEDIFANPELGFKEYRTAGIVAREFQQLGLGYHEELALTGVKTTVSGGKPGPTICVIGELDSVLVADHPSADPETGAAHSCGHNAQITNMLSVANGLVRSGILPELAGNVVFFAVPAEEYVELEERLQLRNEGRTEFLGGKSELIRLGAFDDVDISMYVHAATLVGTGIIVDLPYSSNGFVGKQARFIGRAAHAGGAPHDGINALYAAGLSLEAINAQRETFRDDDSIRIHPILTRGGDLVNVIPNDVRLETMIRGKTIAGIQDADAKVDRALKAGALALGAEVEITSIPGYLPLVNNAPLAELFKDNFLQFFGDKEWTEGSHGAWSTDMGDLSAIMPVLEPNMAGFDGTVHGSDWQIVDNKLAYIMPSKLMAMTIVDLLADGAQEAITLLENYVAPMTKDDYLAFMRRCSRTERYDGGHTE